jgi:uncharacterized Tic20 family protein
MSASNDEKLWAALSHGLALVGCWVAIGQLLAPLIIYLVKKDNSAYVAAHARESLNFQLSILIYVAGLFLLVLTVILALPAVFALYALGVFDLVMVIVATIKAANGESWRYPLCLRLVK